MAVLSKIKDENITFSEASTEIKKNEATAASTPMLYKGDGAGNMGRGRSNIP